MKNKMLISSEDELAEIVESALLFGFAIWAMAAVELHQHFPVVFFFECSYFTDTSIDLVRIVREVPAERYMNQVCTIILFLCIRDDVIGAVLFACPAVTF